MLDDEEYALLVRASRDGLPVTVQGVTIVLKHDLLDRKLWQPSVWIGLRHPIGDGPGLAFPWTPADELRWLEEEGRGYIAATSGDILCIDRVWRLPTGSAFEDDDHPHNREMMVASLSLLRQSGEDVPAGRLAFHGVQSTIRPSAPGDENERIATALFRRLEERCGYDVREYIGQEIEAWPALASTLSMAERHAIFSLLESGGEPTVGFGYWMARAEAEAGVGVVASKRRAQTAKARAKGKVLASANKAEADERWRKPTLELAQRLRAQDPSISQEALTSKLLTSEHAPPRIPEAETVKKTIRAWERQGVLVRSTRNPLSMRGGTVKPLRP